MEGSSPRRRKRGNTGGRPTGRSSILGHPDGKFSCGKGQERKKEQKRKKDEGLWKLTRCGNGGKIEKPRHFPTVSTNAWKTLRKKRSEFPTVPTGPTTAAIHLKKGNFLSEGWGAPNWRFAGNGEEQLMVGRKRSGSV